MGFGGGPSRHCDIFILMSPQLFVPLLAVSHDYFGGALPDLWAFVWAGNEGQLRGLAPPLLVMRGVVGLSLPRAASTGPSLNDFCARLRTVPIFGWEMVPAASDFASYTEWPYRLSQEHPLLDLSRGASFPHDRDDDAKGSEPLRWTARPLRRHEQHLVPVLPGADRPSPEMSMAWGSTQARILARGRPSFSAFATGPEIAGSIERSLAGSFRPEVPQARWSATQARWVYHVFGYRSRRDLEVEETDRAPGTPPAFVELTGEQPVGARSFISRHPQPFRSRPSNPFRLRANGRDLIDALPSPPPFPLRLGPDEQPVADVFVHL